MKVYRDDKNIPYVSDGTTSWFCVNFFQAEAKKKATSVASGSSKASTSIPRSGSGSLGFGNSSTASPPVAPSPPLPGMSRQFSYLFEQV